MRSFFPNLVACFFTTLSLLLKNAKTFFEITRLFIVSYKHEKR